jgi:hypothetical protein
VFNENSRVGLVADYSFFDKKRGTQADGQIEGKMNIQI